MSLFFNMLANHAVYPYKRLEYLESTGTQYIDTGVILNSNSKVEIELADHWGYDGQGGNDLFGYFDTSSSPYVCYATYVNVNNYYFCWSTAPWSGVTGAPQEVTKIKVENGCYYMNDTLMLDKHTLQAFVCTYTACLFTYKKGDGTVPTLRARVKIKSCKIWQDGTTLSRDFIPVLDYNNVACMYDRVSKQFFYNAGTGVFKHNSYTRLEYLESTGTQYIDTGIVANGQTKVETEIFFPHSTTRQTFFGAVNASGYNFALFYSWGTKLYFKYLGDNGELLCSEYEGKYTHFIMDKGDYYVDGVKIQRPAQNFSTDCNMYIFAKNNNGSVIEKAVDAKIKFLKIWNDGVLVRDFIPVLDYNNVACMYDRVSKQFFYNQGTGVFYHNPVSLQYLESTGTQYIDTGVILNSNSKVEIEFYEPFINLGSDSMFLFGYHNSSDCSYASYQNPNGNWSFCFSDEHWSAVRPALTDITKFRIEGGMLYLNEIMRKDLSSSPAFTCSYSAALFTARRAGGVFRIPTAICKIKSCKIWQDGTTLSRDFVPAFNGEPGMYDRVTGQMFYNKGTGTFLYG